MTQKQLEESTDSRDGSKAAVDLDGYTDKWAVDCRKRENDCTVPTINKTRDDYVARIDETPLLEKASRYLGRVVEVLLLPLVGVGVLVLEDEVDL